jgi:hypothetical protein
VALRNETLVQAATALALLKRSLAAVMADEVAALAEDAAVVVENTAAAVVVVTNADLPATVAAVSTVNVGAAMVALVTLAAVAGAQVLVLVSLAARYLKPSRSTKVRRSKVLDCASTEHAGVVWRLAAGMHVLDEPMYW